MQHVDEGDLHAYLDGELTGPGEDPRELETHLEGCGECRARMDEVRLLRERGRGLLADTRPVYQPPFDAVIARSQRPPARAAWLSGRAAPVAWAASLVVALGAGWLARDLLRQDDATRMEVAVSTPSGAADGAALDAGSTRPTASVPGPGVGTELSADAPAAPLRAATRTTAGQAATPAGDGARAGAANDTIAAQAVEARTAATAPPTAAVAAPIPTPVAAAERQASAESARLEGASAAAAPLRAAATMADGEAWMATDRVRAAERLGARVPLVSDLRVISVELSRATAPPTVRIRQALPGGGVLTLFARRAPEPGTAGTRTRAAGATAPTAQSADAAGSAGPTRQLGTLLITAQGPLSADSLQRVLARIR